IDSCTFGRDSKPHSVETTSLNVGKRAGLTKPRRWTRNTRNWTPIGAVTLNPENPELIKTESSSQHKTAIAA
ncbi:MAG: hypothetical protein EBS61_11700, partial [Betaproteobacteria bacterium]|nr:hypothetical protein [Betaproteobacteria bacterium]